MSSFSSSSSSSSSSTATSFYPPTNYNTGQRYTSSSSSPPLTPKDIKDISIARTMFIAGCFLLPWLWIANLIYYRHRLWGDSTIMTFKKNTSATANVTIPCPPELRKCMYLTIRSVNLVREEA